jgi:hypothetical protein
MSEDKNRGGRPNILALSIKEFCRLHSISEPMFYKLQMQGKGPDTMKVGARRLISIEAAAAWRRSREAVQPKSEVTMTNNMDNQAASTDERFERAQLRNEILAVCAGQEIELIMKVLADAAYWAMIETADSTQRAEDDIRLFTQAMTNVAHDAISVVRARRERSLR